MEEVKSSVKVNRPKRDKVIKIIVLILALFVVYTLFKSQMDRQEEMVTVIRVTRSIQAGEPLVSGLNNPDAVPNIEPYKITYNTYKQLSEYYMKTGEKNPLIPSSKVEAVDGQIANYFLEEGTLLKPSMFTDSNGMLNPYIENMNDMYEIYTMDFDAGEVYSRLMIPGALIRVRGVSNVSAEFADEVREYIKQKESKLDLGLELPQDGESVVRLYMATSANSTNNGMASSTPVAEIIFDKIRVVDMLNSSGESLFALYSHLIELPIDQRLEYLSTDISEKNNSSLWKRLTPEKLVLIVSHDDASLLAEFEQLGGMEFKYTLLKPGINDDDLYSQFLDVTDTLQTLIDNYSAESK